MQKLMREIQHPRSTGIQVNLGLMMNPLFLLFDSHLPRLPDLLESDDVNLRIVAGEAIAMFYELAREDDEVSAFK